ncbi:30S ribosomal protein S20 [Candidatus Desantisbacteria bacterium]|nr:30S ribosomal protein S20 [Candidatus Desantisbacteria bacterium]
MPTHKAAEKRIRADKKLSLRNASAKSTLRTLRNKVLKETNKEEAVKTLNTAISGFDKAAQKGIIHKNTAARKISRLAKKVNAIK